MAAADVRPDAFSETEITSTGYALIGVTSLFAIARLGIYWVAPRRPTIEDGLVFFAYISNIAMCSLYIALAPAAARLTNVKMGKLALYPSIREDGRFVSRRYFVAPLLFWLLLWSIKASFLLMYRKLLAGIPKVYTWMPRSKKIGVIALFASGTVCIIIATLRVAQITNNVYKYNMGIDGTWLAIWGMVECSIAVIVGFVPAFAILFRLARAKKSSYNPYGYQKQQEGGSGNKGQQGFVLNTISSKTSRSRKNMGLDTTDSMWVDDASSQEGLAPAPKHDGIMVTTTLQQDHGPRKTDNF
ncbi:hypothetical protein N0V90_004831 [Kalmusia sp. IMI 367209]|nr:hypothetical protein N0V90_004831 [Kalmusia sp. IMI 367209]